MMIIQNGMVFTENHVFEQKDIVIRDGRIAKLRDSRGANAEKTDAGKADAQADEEILDAAGLLVLPGLVDIHFHGAVGHDFCDADPEGLKAIAEYEAAHGVTAICPASMSFSEEILNGVIDNAVAFAERQKEEQSAAGSIDDKAQAGVNKSEADFVGINVEGPFISPNKAGAQNPAYIMEPDCAMFERLMERSRGLIKLVDIAPELNTSPDFIRTFKDKVKISLAHTCTDYETADAAYKAGAKHLTHLYNAMPDMGHRNPGPIPAARENHAEVELIADGVHSHPAMVRLAFSMMDADKLILISDSMMACGLDDGDYQLGGQPVTVHGNVAVITDKPDTIAGSVTNLYDCMRGVIVNMGVAPEQAIRAASENPALSIGIDADYGSIAVGKKAKLILTDVDYNIVKVINR